MDETSMGHKYLADILIMMLKHVLLNYWSLMSVLYSGFIKIFSLMLIWSMQFTLGISEHLPFGIKGLGFCLLDPKIHSNDWVAPPIGRCTPSVVSKLSCDAYQAMKPVIIVQHQYSPLKHIMCHWWQCFVQHEISIWSCKVYIINICLGYFI